MQPVMQLLSGDQVSEIGCAYKSTKPSVMLLTSRV